jgi:hypothetical protein
MSQLSTASADPANSRRRRNCSNSNGSSKTTIGTKFRSNRSLVKVVEKAKAKVRARAKGGKALTLRAKALRVRVFRGVGKSI